MRTYGSYVAEDFDTHGSPFDFNPAPAPVSDLATDKQRNYLVRIAVERGAVETRDDAKGIWTLLSPGGQVTVDMTTLTKRYASQLISLTLSLPKTVETPKVPVQSTVREAAEEGMYQTPDGLIYKVQIAVHGSGKPYAKMLVIGDGGHVSFEYAAGMVYRLRPEWRMSLEDAKAFGDLYGVCCVCGRTLTKEESIAAGIGPICASKF